MQKELEDKLLNDFPELLGDVLNEQTNNFYAPDGWFDLIYNLSDNINKIIKRNNLKQYYVMQVKSKFCGLRYYMNRDDVNEIRELIAEAENSSFLICICCGKTTKRNNKKHYELCENCEIIKNIIE